MIKRNLLWLIFIMLMALTGCNMMLKPTSPPKTVTCPPVEQNCMPGMWTGLPVDTSEAYAEVAPYYYIFEQVKQINSPEDEWCLSFIDKNKAVLTFSDADMNRIMITKLINENTASMESGMGVPLNGSIGALSVQGNKVALASSSNEETLGNSDIYTAVLDGNLLTELTNLGPAVHQTKYTWESQPALSPNGDLIIFASNRAKPTGEIDLWFTVKLKDGSWSTPINCGSAINSDCDELTPYITKNGKTLLFASSGHNGMGGYDIFSSEISDELWKDVKSQNIEKLKAGNYFSKPENLKPPLNTFADELFPTTPGDYEQIMYYSSNQAESYSSIVSMKGGFDIYVRRKIDKVLIADQKKDLVDDFSFDMDDINDNSKVTTPELYTTPTYKLNGTIFNARTSKPAPNAEITIREIPTVPPQPSFAEKVFKDTTGKYKIVELEKDKEFEVVSSATDLTFESFRLRVEGEDTLIVVQANQEGEYLVDLEKDREFEITAQAQDLFFDSFKMRIDKADTITAYNKDFNVPEKLMLRINFPSDNYDNPYKYTLDSNGVETNKTWEEEMNLLAQNILLSLDKIQKIMLVGHTDDVASVAYNNTLGMNRVNFVISELEKRGIPRDLMIGRSAGELEPLAKRKGENIEMYRKRLRRVELQKVLK